MHIKMTETTRGCEDGFTVRRFMEGVTYDVAEMLACDLLRRGKAVRPGTESAAGGVAETADAWLARLAANRKGNIEAEADPARKAWLEDVDAHVDAIDAFYRESRL